MSIGLNNIPVVAPAVPVVAPAVQVVQVAEIDDDEYNFILENTN